MVALTLKDARLELKTTKEAKDILSKAATLDGMDLSSFMMASAMEKARAILRDHSLIALSETAQVQLVNLLNSQPAPTADMLELRKMPRLKVRQDG